MELPTSTANNALLESTPGSGSIQTVAHRRRKNNKFYTENNAHEKWNCLSSDNSTTCHSVLLTSSHKPNNNHSIQRTNNRVEHSVQKSSTERRRMSDNFSYSLVFLPTLIFLFLSSFHIHSSYSSEVPSFQDQFGSTGTGSTGSGSNFNSNRDILSNNNGIYSNNNNNDNGGSIMGSTTAASSSSQFNQQQQQPNIAVAVSSLDPSTIVSSSSSPYSEQTVLTPLYISGRANSIRRISSNILMQLTEREPFALQFKTTCRFGNIVSDENFSIRINSGGKTTYITKPDVTTKVYHNVSDGQWHSIMFQGYTIDPNENEENFPLIDWAENNTSVETASHFFNFFDGFVGCIRLQMPMMDPNHDETFYSHPESPSERTINALHPIVDLFRPTHPYDYNDDGICNENALANHPCLDPEHFILCESCKNGADCEEDPDHSNNRCQCRSSDELEYCGKDCSIPRDENGDCDQESSPSQLSINATLNTVLSTIKDFVPHNATSTTTTTTTTTARPEEEAIKPFTWTSSESCPCHNNVTCTKHTLSTSFCNCTGSGFRGIYCNDEVDECAEIPLLCNEGLCKNSRGSYQCYCKPGYAGRNCEKNIQECLSNPCKNNGTCHDGIDEYRCECVKGYEGIDCEKEIDECEPGPCQNGATCIDRVGYYECQCAPGYSDENCSTDIDECASNPCLNDGQCRDQVNGFLCNCTDTGFEGDTCENNVDDCQGVTCEHGGSCVDFLKDYNCTCQPGYEGKNCENDIDECEASPCKNGGECYQKSNETLYNLDWNHPLRELLSNEFSYDNAGGFVCLCPEGFNESDCSHNIDDCKPDSCGRNGDCRDGIASFSCDCHKGYEGIKCDSEINECDSNPCVNNGTCSDKIGDFDCTCPKNFGAKTCDVELIGCKDTPCTQFARECVPRYDEGIHSFFCDCPEGFAGERCEMNTTMSFNGTGPVVIERPSESGSYELSFRFKTTLPDVALAVGSGGTYFSLTLKGGKLNLRSSLLNNLDGIYSGSSLSDADWHKVWISINTSHIALAAGSEQTIHPVVDIHDVEREKDKDQGFNMTFLGGFTSGTNFLNNDRVPSFSGCIQDIKINSEKIILEHNLLNATTVTKGCPRTNQCNPNPCINGKCTDLWHNFTCECERPYLGDRCQYEYIAATFHHENVSNSLVSVNISSEVGSKFTSTFDISMFVRTRSKSGTIFILAHENNGNYSVFLEAEIGEVGNLVIQAKWSDVPDDPNSKAETYAVDGLQITDGYIHRISIQREKTLVKISVNGTEHFRKSVSNKNKFNPNVLFIGGKPIFTEPIGSISNAPLIMGSASEPIASFLKSDGETVDFEQNASSGVEEDSSSNTEEPNFADAPPLVTLPVVSEEDPLGTHVHPDTENEITIVTKPFKGVIQDFRVNYMGANPGPSGMSTRSQNYYVVEFFPLGINATYAMGEPLGTVKIQNIKNGTVTDNTCRININPCINGGTCQVTWNDFNCLCTPQYDGKVCDTRLRCADVVCPEGSVCHNIGWTGFECVAEAAFDGKDKESPHYILSSTEKDNITFNEASFRFRTKHTGSVLYVGNDSQSFRIDLRSINSTDFVSVFINGTESKTQKPLRILDGEWHTLSTKFSMSEAGPELKVYVDEFASNLIGDGKTKAPEAILTLTPVPSFSFLSDLILSDNTEIVVGSNLDLQRSYYQDENGGSSNMGHAENDHHNFYRGCLADVKLGQYRLPFVTPSELERMNQPPTPENNSSVRITAPTAFYIQESPSGLAPHLGCILCYDDECLNNGTCKNAKENYECDCSRGYEGDHCETNIDECAENECENGSTCMDGVDGYTCLCPAGFKGIRCEENIDECLLHDYPCHNGGTCRDAIADFTCECTEEFTGRFCDKRKKSKCSDDPCENGASCQDLPENNIDNENRVSFKCSCARGWRGETCSEEINYCENTTCSGRGKCINNKMAYGFICDCIPGYDGPTCEKEIDECACNPCQHNGICTDGINSYICDCDGTGFMGPVCEEDVDECQNDPCSRVQRCENTVGSFKCICPDWRKCGENCDIDDPCYENGNKTCLNGGTCTSSCPDEEAKEWKCLCAENYEGQFCDLLTMARPNQPLDILLIIIPVLAALLIAATIAIVILVRMARRKRATRGVYSPSQQEYCNPRVELDNVMKPPPEERLI